MYHELSLYLFVVHTHTGYVCWPENAPVFMDSCYVEAPQIGALRWKPLQSCEMGLLFTQAECNASDATVETFYSTNETSVFLPPSNVSCIQVRPLISSENCDFRLSTCAQVESLKQGMHLVVVLSKPHTSGLNCNFSTT